MVRVGLYARVSTLDQQTLPMQIRALRAYTRHQGWTIVLQIKDVGSGANEQLQRELLLKAARRRELDAILVWRLDRSFPAVLIVAWNRNWALKRVVEEVRQLRRSARRTCCRCN